MKEQITITKEIETNGNYCEQSCEGCIVDHPIAECSIFNYNLELKDGKVLRCVKCLNASGIE